MKMPSVSIHLELFILIVFSRCMGYKTLLEQHVLYQKREQLNQSYIVSVNGP